MAAPCQDEQLERTLDALVGYYADEASEGNPERRAAYLATVEARGLGVRAFQRRLLRYGLALARSDATHADIRRNLEILLQEYARGLARVARGPVRVRWDEVPGGPSDAAAAAAAADPAARA